MKHPIRCSDSAAAFTLIELLVVTAVLAILLSLSIGALRSSRATARRLQCLTHIRNSGQLVFVYGAEQRDALPFGGFERRKVSINGVVKLAIGGPSGLQGRHWTALFPDEWSGWVWNPAARCPQQPKCSTAIEPDQESLGTWFAISSATWLDARTLAATASVADTRPQPNTFADVLFPSKKVLLFESRAYCESTSTNQYWISIGQTPFEPSSTLCADGSASRTIRANGLAALYTMPYDYTIDGVRGRDLP